MWEILGIEAFLINSSFPSDRKGEEGGEEGKPAYFQTRSGALKDLFYSYSQSSRIVT